MTEKRGTTPVILPPSKLRLNIWELLKYHIPQYVKHQPNKLIALRKVFNKIEHFNDQLSSRIHYQIIGVNHGGSTYTQNIVVYDEALINIINSIIPMVVELRDEFKQFSVDVRSGDDPDAVTVIYDDK